MAGSLADVTINRSVRASRPRAQSSTWSTSTRPIPLRRCVGAVHMETSITQVRSSASINPPAMPQPCPSSIARKPIPVSPFHRFVRSSHSASVNCDSLANVEPNACGVSCSARSRISLNAGKFDGVTRSIVVDKVFWSLASRAANEQHSAGARGVGAIEFPERTCSHSF
jgi:hypothetical protein